MYKIIAAIIGGIFLLIGAWMEKGKEPNSLKEPSITKEVHIEVDESTNKRSYDSHDTVIITTQKMTKIENAKNVIID